MKLLFFPVLKKVARSFYLTIRLLPSKLQEPIALAYLLARASDTIADQAISSLQEGESDLLTALPLLLKELNDPRRDRLEANMIKSVWEKILQGQSLDLAYEEEKLSCHAPLSLFTHEALDQYLYLVAGSVGEFWTEIAAYHLLDFSKETLEIMIVRGIDYGKGLQLTNILRDRHEDAQQGRVYCSQDQFSELYAQACTYLQQGRSYIEALRPGRFKLASALPLLLAEETLSLVANNPHVPHIKVSRARVYFTFLRALPLLVF